MIRLSGAGECNLMIELEPILGMIYFVAFMVRDCFVIILKTLMVLIQMKMFIAILDGHYCAVTREVSRGEGNMSII